MIVRLAILLIVILILVGVGFFVFHLMGSVEPKKRKECKKHRVRSRTPSPERQLPNTCTPCGPNKVLICDRTLNQTLCVDFCSALDKIGTGAAICGPCPVIPPPPAFPNMVVTDYLSNTLAVFATTATGNVAPLRTISGPLTTLVSPNNAIGDNKNNEIVVVNTTGGPINLGSLTVFSNTANGNVAPLRTITGGTNTELSTPQGLAVDTVNNEYLVANLGLFNKGVRGYVTVYSRTANGDVAPLRSFWSSVDLPGTFIAGAGFGTVYTVDVNTTADEIYLGGSGDPGFVATFSRTASGAVAPLRVIAGSNANLGFVAGVQLDATPDELFVLRPDPVNGSSILVFPRTASGNVAPSRAIHGPATMLLFPDGRMTIDSTNITVTDFLTPQVLTFVKTASGNVAPIRIISGGSTMLDGAFAVTPLNA